VIIGGLVASTTDALGAFYAPNDCGYDSVTDMWGPPSPPYQGQQVPNFRSAHPGAVPFAMGDGSVRLIKTTVNRNVYMGLSTVSGGEILSSASY
jgi:hypothetical protein